MKEKIIVGDKVYCETWNQTLSFEVKKKIGQNTQKKGSEKEIRIKD